MIYFNYKNTDLGYDVIPQIQCKLLLLCRKPATDVFLCRDSIVDKQWPLKVLPSSIEFAVSVNLRVIVVSDER